jgi:hypothetical protein
MTSEDFIIDLFCRVDEQMKGVAKHPQASLWPSEVVTLAMLHALKGTGPRAFYRWLCRDYRGLFPRLPERTRLFRLFATHWLWARVFLASPSLLGVADTFGIELRHPLRQGRHDGQLGAKGLSNHRWIAGIQWGVVLDHLGRIVRWVWAPANSHDKHFQVLVRTLDGQMVVFADQGFHDAAGDAPNLTCCRRGQHNERMLVETVFSMLTTLSHVKKVTHRAADALQARLAYTAALFNVLVQWHGLQPDENGFVPLSIAEFSL